MKTLDTCGDGIILTDPNRNDNPIIYCNRQFSKLTGYSSKEIIGKNCRFLQAHDTKQPEVLIIREAIKRKEKLKITLRNYRKDGSMFWNELSLSPIHGDRGELLYYIGIQNNVTKKVQTQMQQREKILLLEENLKKCLIVLTNK